MAAGGGKRESRGREMDVTGRGCAGGGQEEGDVRGGQEMGTPRARGTLGQGGRMGAATTMVK